MKPETTIPVQPWMISPETRAVMEPLNQNAPEIRALFVGGCVRNTLLGIDVGDIDIATRLHPAEVVDILGKAGVKTVPTGIDHGTVTAVVNGAPYEITTLRRDVETNGRRAVVAFAENWEEDAQRRDFTMNTLLADNAGTIYDPTGQGLADLKARRVVFVGDPAQRIAEDVLRILRFFRFHALYGAGAPDEAALAACRAQADKIPVLSRERIGQEFFKILLVDNPVDILWVLLGNGILSESVLLHYPTDVMSFYCRYEKRKSLAARLFIVAGCAVDNMAAWDNLLIIPGPVKKEIKAIASALEEGPFDSDQAVKKVIYLYGRDAACAALIISAARGGVNEADLPAWLMLTEGWDIPVFPVSGHDLISRGLSPGPELGYNLKQLEDKWISAGFDDSIL